MSKSLTVKKFITLACEAIDGLSKTDARETYKSIKDSTNPIWSDFTDISTLLSQKVELNEQIEELEEEIDDNPDNKDEYISKINLILSSESSIKLIHILETGFNKKHGTFAQLSDDYSININTLQNYKPNIPKKKQTNKPIKTTSKKKKKIKTKTETNKNKNSKNKKLNKQKSVKNTKYNSKLNKQKSIKNNNKNTNSKKLKHKSQKRAGKSSTTESASKYKRRNNAKTDKSKNLSPSKVKKPKLRNRSSTEEDIKNGKVKRKKNDKMKKNKGKKMVKNNDKKQKKGKKKNVNQNDQPKSPTPTSPKTPMTPITPVPNPKTPVSPQVSATEIYNDHGDEKKEVVENVGSIDSMDSDGSDNRDRNYSHISTQSQDMSSAFAMFERLSSPKASNNGGFFAKEPQSPTQKIQKKGKRYFDFKPFSSGAFSKVYKAKDKENNNKTVAVKKIHIGGNRNDNGFEPTTKEEGDNEVRILKLVNDHSNTCNLVETYFDMKLGINSGYVLCIVMEYMHYTLKDRMDYYGEKGDVIPFHLIKIYLFQLCKAVNWMHIKNVCHRDIKPENVLINVNTNRLQLCDFGCSIVLGKNEYNDDEKYQYEESDDGYETYVMSRFYRAPELILGNRLYDCYADIWSLGVVISEIFLGTISFMGSSNLDQMREIILKLGWPNKEELKDMNPSITKFDKIDGVYGVDKSTMGESFNMMFLGVMDMEETAVDLISRLLVYSPDDRLSAGECLEHEYFNQIKSLMNKSIKKKKNFGKKNLKMKKEDIVPNDMFRWNDIEIKYAKSKNIKLRK